ncbi:pteroicidin-alpha-like [Toxotes jaculatrix]|uniref:pteroicidin-alpha-like n=1 Tax=Toxotes jaculatrix TaxID=941984 RepID=UPI001B3AA663|nr:pteroicidin-alpha-like [Toxotes jaculatrix]
MKCVGIFLVLSLVILMAEPGECLFKRLKSMWKSVKAAFRGAKQAWRESRNNEEMRRQNKLRYQQEQPNDRDYNQDQP